MNKAQRIARLERSFAPHVLSTFRFITWFEVAADDERDGTHLQIKLIDSPIGEVVVFAATRAGYCKQRESLRANYFLLEG